MEFLCEFDFEIKHVKAKENEVINALSRKFHLTTINIYKEDLRERILESLSSDKMYIQIKEEQHK